MNSEFYRHCYFLLFVYPVICFLRSRSSFTLPSLSYLREKDWKDMQTSLVPTQVVKTRPMTSKLYDTPKEKEDDLGDEVVFIKHWGSLSISEKLEPCIAEKLDRNSASTTSKPDSEPQNDVYEPKYSPEELKGNTANVHWRSIPMDDVREHPNFRSLPPPETIRIRSVKDLCLFRQDTLQWDMLHQGRLTTSKLASILGFYEKHTALFLQIPMSLQGHDRAVNAWHHLCSNRPTDWSHLQIPFPVPSSSSTLLDTIPSSSRWKKNVGGSLFEYSYCPFITDTKTSSSRGYSTASSARLAWGSAQESTALLTAINHFSREGIKVQEAGMNVFEALFLSSSTSSSSQQIEQKQQEKEEDEVVKKRKALYDRVYEESMVKKILPLLGASPDGILIHSSHPTTTPNNNSSQQESAADLITRLPIEVLEIKCFSPFITAENTHSHNLRISFHTPSNHHNTHHNNHNHNDDTTSSNHANHHSHEMIPVWHIPQLQWEIFCAGANCTSAILEVFSISNVIFYRLPRNDTYIELMIDLVKEFYATYILQVPRNRRKAPPMNFFQPTASSSTKYRQFLTLTKELAQQAEKIAELPNASIQRNSINTKFFLD